MSTAAPQHVGRAEAVRTALASFPQGATIAQIKQAGRINASHQAIGYTLTGLARSGQAVCHRHGVRGIWRLAPHVQHAVAPIRAAPARPSGAATGLVLALQPGQPASDSATTARHKEFERQELAAHIAAFEAGGGVIEILGVSPLRPNLGRREANDAAFGERISMEA